MGDNLRIFDPDYDPNLQCCASGLNSTDFGAEWNIYANGYLLSCADRDDCSESFDTGPLVGSTSSSWIFAGGGSFAFTGLNDAIPPLPPGITCVPATIGLGCDAPPGSGDISGEFSGDVTLTVTNAVFFSLSGPVVLNLNPGLADWAGMAEGTYVGTLTFDGVGSLEIPEPPSGFSIQNTAAGELEVSVTNVPEPRAIYLLLDVLAVAGAVGLKRQLARRPNFRG
jgi:hypothetical protein